MKDQVTIFDTVKLFLAHWWKIAIAALVCAILAYCVSSYYMTPVYTSRGSIYISSSTQKSQNVTLNELATSQQLAYTYVELLSSDTFMTQVKEYSQLPYTAQQMKSMIGMAPLNETEIIEVEAVSYYPEHAQILVDSVLKNAQDEIVRITQSGNISVVDAATLPQEPSSPSVSRNTIVGFLFGAILSMMIIFLLDLFDTRIKTEEEVLKVKSLPVLGIIPEIEAKEKSKDPSKNQTGGGKA